MATPNIYADQIEWMHRNLARRDSIVLSPAPAQRPRHRRRRRRAGLHGRRRPDRGLPVRQRRAHRQRLPGHAGHEPVLARASTRRSTSPTSTRSAAPSSTATSCRSTPRHPYGGELVYTAFSGSTRTRSRRGSSTWSATPPRPASPVDEFTWEVPYLPIDPQGHRPHLRGGHPGQQPVGQGRRRLHHEARPPPRPAAPAADRVLPGRTGAHRRRGRRGQPGPMWDSIFRRIPAQPGQPVGPPGLMAHRHVSTGRREGRGSASTCALTVRSARSRASATAPSPPSATPWLGSVSRSASSTMPSTR